ncbi:TadE/TadG family type IV pilus assembly protein [Sphingobium baderi]|uniref:TadE/TadG family type IV pilus assembly protein n=1 Tax=Sphingobium baderi TaxID=1332080 RepID=UPI002B417E76|nr:TadE family protein [Sphingobium baderi]WRD78844.1 pilus assembly protein [Sphingobium baderi]
MDERGAVSIEFAIIVGVFLAVFFSMVDMAHYYATRHSLQEAVNMTARAAMLDPLLAGCDAATTRAKEQFLLLRQDSLNICVVQNDSEGLQSITVNASMTFNIGVYHMLTGSPDLSESLSVSLPKA